MCCRLSGQETGNVTVMMYLSRFHCAAQSKISKRLRKVPIQSCLTTTWECMKQDAIEDIIYTHPEEEERTSFLFGFHWLSHREFYYFAQMSNCLIIYYVLGLFKKENLLYSRNWSAQNFLFWKFTGCCIFFSHLTARVHIRFMNVVTNDHAALLNITVLGSN